MIICLCLCLFVYLLLPLIFMHNYKEKGQLSIYKSLALYQLEHNDESVLENLLCAQVFHV